MCAVVLLQEHGHLAREEILRDPRNHGLMPDAADRLKVLHLDFEEFTTIRYRPGWCDMWTNQSNWVWMDTTWPAYCTLKACMRSRPAKQLCDLCKVVLRACGCTTRHA